MLYSDYIGRLQVSLAGTVNCDYFLGYPPGHLVLYAWDYGRVIKLLHYPGYPGDRRDFTPLASLPEKVVVIGPEEAGLKNVPLRSN